MTTISLEALQAFYAVAQAQSFTRAAARLGQDKSRVSRTVRALEASLAVVLLARSTRSVRLTPAGEALFRRIAPLLAGLEEAVAAVPDRASIPSGEVVVATTPDIGRALLAPALTSFRARYPSVSVRVELAHELADLMGEGIDLALRVGRPGPGSVIARKLGELEAAFFAAPAYLERRGEPNSVDALADHEGLWPVPRPGQRTFSVGKTPPRPAVQCADFGLLAELARSGAGIAVLPKFLAARDLATGALVRVLPRVSLGGAPLYLVSRPLKPLPPRVAALRTHLLAAIRTT